MKNEIEYLGIIPARGGSKGIPKKNVKPLKGKPLVVHSIVAAIESDRLQSVLVSTDDEQVQSLLTQFNSSKLINRVVSYQRPAELATDDTPMIDTILHAIDWLEKERAVEVKNIVLLQPTSPLRTSQDIDSAIRLYEKQSATSLISVHEMQEHPYECIESHQPGWSFLKKPAKPVERRQEYANNFYFMNSAIFIRQTKALRETKVWFEEGKSALFEMPAIRGVDINTEFDFKLAENLL
ncbi:MAG: acylneuraminate cytidylyltransferase family protein [Bacteriovoracia bacterium]